MYKYGLGANKNKTLAYMWFNFAALQGSKSAEKTLRKLALHMSSPQIKKAQDLARECVKKNYKGC